MGKDKIFCANLIALILGCILSRTNGEPCEGCKDASWTSCCEIDTCQLPKSSGKGFCNISLYTSDCCANIESICPPSTGPDRIPTITSISMEFLLINPAVNNSRLFIQVLIDAGSPTGLLLWKHNGSLVSSRTNPRVNILAGGGLTVRNVMFSDSGMYTVSVSNRLGESIKKFRVLFQFIDFISSYSSVHETTVNFGCSVRSYPFVFFRSWSTRAGVTVNGTSELRLNASIEVVLVNTLIGVTHLDCIQAGGYSCQYASGPTIFHNSVSVFLECPIVPAEVMFERTFYCVAEGDRELEVCVEVTFSSRSTKEINVTVSLSQDVVQTRAASAGADFNIPLASMNNIPLASMNVSRSHPRACMTIEIVDDTVMEDEEEFILILTADNALSVVTHPNSTNVIILDDDDTF